MVKSVLGRFRGFSARFSLDLWTFGGLHSELEILKVVRSKHLNRSKPINGTSGPDAITLAYLHGRFDSQIESFAASLGVPSTTLAARLAALLSPTGAGSGNSMPIMPSQTSGNGGAVETLALAQLTH